MFVTVNLSIFYANNPTVKNSMFIIIILAVVGHVNGSRHVEMVIVGGGRVEIVVVVADTCKACQE
jgi:hypothetical protein